MTPPLRLRPAVRYRIAAIPLSVVRERSTSTRGAQLLGAMRQSVLRALTAERADAYVTILAEMLALRRSGELAPTLDELRRQVVDPIENDELFLRDLLQLEEWGCLTRELELRSIRGYRDARRERYRHRLTDDAVAFLEWLEARAARCAAPVAIDAEDRLIDVLDRAGELARLVNTETWPPDEVAGRRIPHLARSIHAELDAITRSLVTLHGEMQRFVGRTFERHALERVIAGLEAYVAGLLGHVGERRRQISEVVARLTIPEALGRLASMPALSTSPLSVGDDSSIGPGASRWSEFFDDGGTLDDLSARIETATHEVIAKLRDRVSTLERRGDRNHERACGIRALAGIDETAEGTLPVWGMGVPTWAPGDGTRLVPPLPRRKTRACVDEPRALTTKRVSNEIAPEPRQARARRVAAWLREAGLADGSVQLSSARTDALRGVEAPTAWILVARARHLRGGAGLSELGVRIERTAGVVTVGNDTVGLASPDCVVSSIELSPPESRP